MLCTSTHSQWFVWQSHTSLLLLDISKVKYVDKEAHDITLMTSHNDITHTSHTTSHAMASHVATARIGHTLNDISKFSAPHISICTSKVPISKKNCLSSANMHPSIMGVYSSLFSQIEGQRSLTTTVTCQHSKILVECRTMQTGRSRHVHGSHIHSAH